MAADSQPLRMKNTADPDEWMDPNHVMVVLTETERHHALGVLLGRNQPVDPMACDICASVIGKLRRVATGEGD